LSIIINVLELLHDGKWYNVTKIAKSLNIKQEYLDGIASFLDKYELANVSRNSARIKLTKDFIALPDAPRKKLETQTGYKKLKTKAKSSVWMNITGRFDAIEGADKCIMVTGNNLEIKEMKHVKPLEFYEHATRNITASKETAKEQPFLKILNSYEDAVSLLLERVEFAKKKVLLATRFRNDLVINALLRKANEGVQVRVIADTELVKEYISSQYDTLSNVKNNDPHIHERTKIVSNPWYPEGKVKRRVGNVPFTFAVIDDTEFAVELTDLHEPKKFMVAMHTRDEFSSMELWKLFETLWGKSSEDMAKITEDILSEIDGQ
jgi:hypothetical protein